MAIVSCYQGEHRNMSDQKLGNALMTGEFRYAMPDEIGKNAVTVCILTTFMEGQKPGKTILSI